MNWLAANVEYYASIVADLSLQRDVIFAANEVLEDAYSGDYDGTALVQRADTKFLGLEAKHGSVFTTPEQAVNQLFVDLDHRMNHPGHLSGIDTGLTTLNEMTGGWQPCDLILIPARVSIGKTALILNMAKVAASTAGPVAFFSLEMSQQQIEYRLLSHLSGVMMFRILRGWLGQVDYQQIADAMEVRRSLPLYIDDTPRIGIHEIRRKDRRFKAATGLKLIAVDYVQLITSGGRRKDQTRTEELGEVSRLLKGLAKELDVPVIAAAQLSRAPMGRSDHRPQLSDIRESGTFEQDADIVAMIHRKDHKESGECEILLEKQRNGPTGAFFVNFNRDTTSFSDWTESDVPKDESRTRTQPARTAAQRIPYSEAE